MPIGRLLKGVVITTGDPDSVNDGYPTTTAMGSQYDLRGQLGAVHRSADGLEEWIYARFSSTSTGKAPAANQLCFWHDEDSWVVDNQTSASSATVFKPAGVLSVAATRGNMVWLKRKSLGSLVASTSTTALGGNAVVGTTASGEPAVVSSTSTIAPATGIGASPWFIGRPGIGVISSTATTNGANDGTYLEVALSIQ